jgi:hypothetical protein
MDDYERRSRVISLVYDVLRDDVPVPDDAKESEILSALAKTFAERALDAAAREAAQPEIDPDKLPRFIRYPKDG